MTIKKKYIVATRPSILAFTQTQLVVELLKEKNPGCQFEIVKFSTHGDKVADKPLTEFGGIGIFVKELENAILQGKADFAVHSLKDVPTIQPGELMLASFVKRENPQDVFLTKNNLKIEEIKEDCIIGTGSPRRMVQIAAIKPKAVFKDLRGNIDTRLRKLEEEQYDSIVVAAAGLIRLGKNISENSFISTEKCIPAIGQGVIALECKKDDKETIDLIRTINHYETEIAVKAERGFMLAIGGGCKFPLAAYATVENNFVNLIVMLGNQKTNKTISLSDKAEKDKAEELGKRLAEKIKKEAGEIGLEFLI
ncbi:MAG: hydroxymethylbilane synthase [Bacteroidales bacterium]|nr:hydroxymethylbilane synthase [Bacteroidales bacterium]